MRTLSVALVMLALALPGAHGQALRIAYNGSALAAPQASSLHPVPGAAPGEAGLSLAELFPPQLEAWRLELGGRSIDSDSLGERLHDIFLVRGAAGWDLVMDVVMDVVLGVAGSRRERIPTGGVLGLRGEPCPEKSLEVWISWEGVPELKALLSRWAESAGISLKAVDVPSIKSKLIAVLRGGGSVPDVVMVQSDYLPDLAAAGAVQELDGLALPSGAAKGRDSFTLAGRLLAAPFYCDTQLVFYSRRYIKSAPSPTWTLADMERLALGSGAAVPAAWNAYSAYWFLPFVLGFGRTAVVDGSGRLGLADPAFAKALSYVKDAVGRGFLVPMERDAMMSYFVSGKASFILSGSYSLPEFRRLGLDIGIAAYPLAEAGGKGIPPLLDFKGFSVTRTTKRPVLARRLVQFLSSPGVQARFCAPQGKLPANEEAWPLLPAGDPYQPFLQASYRAGVAVPAHPAYGEFKNAIWKLMRLYLGGSMSGEETIAAARTILKE